MLFLIFINDLSNDIKSKIRMFADVVKLIIKPISKETTLMDVNKLSGGEDILKLIFQIEKYKVFI